VRRHSYLLLMRKSTDLALGTTECDDIIDAEIVTPQTKERVAEPTQAAISEVMAALGRRGGRKGGPARAAKLGPRRRRAIAKKAAQARWNRG
jgi:hypothetical protein